MLLISSAFKVNVLSTEISVLAQKVAMHSHMMLFIQHFLVPMNNVLRSLRGLNEQALPPLEVFVSNDNLRYSMVNDATQTDFENLLMLEIFHSFLFRDMNKAQQIADLIKVHITKKPLVFNYVMVDLFVGLTSCYLSRSTNKNQSTNESRSEDTAQISLTLQTCEKLKWLTSHSKWNFENKYLLLLAECQYTQGKMEMAAATYEASIKSAKQHKFINEQAIACELAGYFYKDQGDETTAMDMFKQAHKAYMQWGAIGKAKLIQESTGMKDVCSPSSDQTEEIKDLSSPLSTVALQQTTGIELASIPIETSEIDRTTD